MNTVKYEVAFSFCKEDESLSSQMNDLIQDRYSTFIYYEKQKELAGKDGEIEFKKVFRNESRVVVILYRSNWGNTPWTRMEETAIRERAYDEGYNFTLFIPTENNIKMPEWLPRQRLWYGLERYGVDGAASVIELKIQENFGQIREENAEEKAKRLQRKIAYEKKKRRLLNSIDGVQAAYNEIKTLFAIIEDIADKSTDKEVGLLFIVHKGDKYCDFFTISGNYCIQTKWESYSWNTLSGSYLLVELTTPIRNRRNPIIYSKYKFLFDLNEANNYGWLSSDKKFFSSESLANYLFKILLNKIEEEIN
jgi:hypothetical protein